LNSMLLIHCAPDAIIIAENNTTNTEMCLQELRGGQVIELRSETVAIGLLKLPSRNFEIFLGEVCRNDSAICEFSASKCTKRFAG